METQACHPSAALGGLEVLTMLTLSWTVKLITCALIDQGCQTCSGESHSSVPMGQSSTRPLQFVTGGKYNLPTSGQSQLLSLLRFRVSCDLSESLYASAYDADESCPAVEAGATPDDCESDCWSPGQRDTDCVQSGLCW